MARSPRRRAPVQSRSRATVADILAATARLVEREGHESLTIDRIARVAGVGVGSIYEYFASKGAIVEALQDQHFARMGDELLARMQELEEAPVSQLVFEVANLMRTSEILNSKLSRQLLAVPWTKRPRAVIELEERCADILYRALLRVAPRADPASLRIAVFLVVQTVEALIVSTSQHRPRGLTRHRFTQELGALVFRYLAPILNPKNPSDARIRS
jgi:AcrR family transcriptional regulator